MDFCTDFGDFLVINFKLGMHQTQMFHRDDHNNFTSSVLAKLA